GTGAERPIVERRTPISPPRRAGDLLPVKSARVGRSESGSLDLDTSDNSRSMVNADTRGRAQHSRRGRNASTILGWLDVVFRETTECRHGRADSLLHKRESARKSWLLRLGEKGDIRRKHEDCWLSLYCFLIFLLTIHQ